MNKSSVFCVATVLVCLSAFSDQLRAASSDLPANVDSALRTAVAESAQTSATTSAATATPKSNLRIVSRAMRDTQSRVLVNIRLSGKNSLASVHSQLVDAGANIIAESSDYRNGVLSAFVPVDKVAEFAQYSGIKSMSLARRPYRNIGATTSGGVYVLHTDLLNAQGINGQGLTVGVLSDSYDTATTDENGNPLTIHAAQDVSTGDLPGAGNPDGNTTPVNVLQDQPNSPDSPTTDEGRAMLQIVHDVAPNANLAFATAYPTEVAFANDIRALRTSANCDVIVDDVIYTEDPFFSDGMLGQAVNDVAFSSVLAGHKVMYFSAAGNQQGGGWTATFNPVSDGTARAGLPNQNVQLGSVDPSLTSGGFHNFNPDPSGPVDISQTFPIPAQTQVEVDLQWNDPFDQGGVTTDYNLLVFDAQGNFLAEYSGTADNFSTDEPIEDMIVENNTDTDTTFQIVISRAGNSPSTPVASKLRYLALDEFGDGISANEYYQEGAPTTFGHSCATGAVGVAAYVYTQFPTDPVAPPFFPQIEDYTSPGPATIYFDSSGNRLATPQVRQKPDVAAPDGVNTTFFGSFDYEGDGFPNFFGSSAAAPHAAGVAALLLQKAGGSDSLTMAQIRGALQQSVLNEHDIDPFFSRAVAISQPAAGGKKGKKGGKQPKTSASVAVTAAGDSSNGSSRDPNFFTVTFNPSKANETLVQVKIDLTNAGLSFDTTDATGFPLTLGKVVGISPQSIGLGAPAEDGSFEVVTLVFAAHSFTGATSVSFGLDRDLIGEGGGNSADLLQNAQVTATTSKGATVGGLFNNMLGFGYSIADGFGFIDGQKAAQQVPSASSSAVKR